MFRPDGSTGSRSRPLSPLVGRGFERNRFVVWRCGEQNKLVAQTMISVKLLVWPCTKRCSPGPTLDQPLDQSIYHFSCLFGLLSDNKHYCDLHWVNRVLHALLSYWHFRVSLVFIAFDSRYVLCARKCHKTWPLASEGMRDSSLEFAAI